MISTTQLRILRTVLHTSPSNTPGRLARVLNAPSRRTHQALLLHAQQQPPPSCAAASRLFFSTSNHVRQESRVEPPEKATTPLISSATANPPPTTRPPPLDLPTRGPNTSTTSHLFATGKAYLTFYKTGLRHIYINTRLVWSLNTASGIPPDHTPPGDTAEPTTVRAAGTTRSTELLRRRWRHDVRRLPVFALLLLICGEFTPLVVLAMPAVVPITCRIPRQVEKLRRKAEERRGFSFESLQRKYGEKLDEESDEREGSLVAEKEGQMASKSGVATTTTTVATTTGATTTSMKQKYLDLSQADITVHVARSLNLISTIWDSAPLSLLPDTLVSIFASRRVRRHLAYLDRDNHLLAQAGGVAALEEEEVLLACEDRGIWPVPVPVPVGDKSDLAPVPSTARENLRRWLYLVGDDEGHGGGGFAGEGDNIWSAERAAEREARMVVLMMRREWPRRQVTVRTSARILQGKGE